MAKFFDPPKEGEKSQVEVRMMSRSETKIKGILRTDNKSVDAKKDKKIKFSLLPSKRSEV